MTRGRVDYLALAASGLAAVMLVVYVAVMFSQDDEPLAWFVTAMVIGAALAGYGVVRSARQRRTALLVAAVVLGAMGLLGLLTIGAPILLAGALCLVSALLDRPAVTADR